MSLELKFSFRENKLDSKQEIQEFLREAPPKMETAERKMELREVASPQLERTRGSALSAFRRPSLSGVSSPQLGQTRRRLNVMHESPKKPLAQAAGRVPSQSKIKENKQAACSQEDVPSSLTTPRSLPTKTFVNE